MYTKEAGLLGQSEVTSVKNANESNQSVKIRSEANPFDPQFKEYFEQRENIVKGSQRVSRQQLYPSMYQIAE